MKEKALNFLLICIIFSILIVSYDIITFLFLLTTEEEISNSKILSFSASWSHTTKLIFIVAKLLLKSFLLYLLFNVLRIVKLFSQNNYFEELAISRMLNIGKLLIIYGVLTIIMTFMLENSLLESSSYNLGFAFGKSLKESIPTFIYSSIILVIASIAKEGNLLKQENDLTI